MSNNIYLVLVGTFRGVEQDIPGFSLYIKYISQDIYVFHLYVQDNPGLNHIKTCIYL